MHPSTRQQFENAQGVIDSFENTPKPVGGGKFETYLLQFFYNHTENRMRGIRDGLNEQDKILQRYRDYWYELHDSVLLSNNYQRKKYIYGLIWIAIQKIVLNNVDVNRPCDDPRSWNMR